MLQDETNRPSSPRPAKVHNAPRANKSMLFKRSLICMNSITEKITMTTPRLISGCRPTLDITHEALWSRESATEASTPHTSGMMLPIIILSLWLSLSASNTANRSDAPKAVAVIAIDAPSKPNNHPRAAPDSPLPYAKPTPASIETMTGPGIAPAIPIILLK